MMHKIFKPLIALSIIAAFAFSAVLCCCTATAVMAHFHKPVTCSHCPDQNSQGKSSAPTGACHQQLTNAEFAHGQGVSLSNVSVVPYFGPAFLNHHHILLTHILILAYPPGGPPLGISLTPLYLRTFNLRI